MEEMSNWGSVQYDKAHETFYRLMGMDRQEALAELGIKELKTVLPETIVKYVGFEDDSSEEEIDKQVSIRQFFNKTRDEAWDLWEAAGCAFIQMFDGEAFVETDYDTGQECFILWISGAFEGEDADETFGGFST